MTPVYVAGLLGVLIECVFVMIARQFQSTFHVNLIRMS